MSIYIYTWKSERVRERTNLPGKRHRGSWCAGACGSPGMDPLKITGSFGLYMFFADLYSI